MLTETLQPVLCLFIHFRICFTVLKVKLSAIKPLKHLKALSKLFFLFLKVISKSCYFHSSVTLPTWCVKSSHTPQCSPEWELGHWGTKAKKGAYGLETTPPPWSVKHSSPNTAQGSYPHWSAGNGLNLRQCPSPPACSLLNWPSMQRVARVGERACWIEGSACGRQDSVCFYYSRQLLSSEELIPHPSPRPKVWPSVIETHFNVILKAATFNILEIGRYPLMALESQKANVQIPA